MARLTFSRHRKLRALTLLLKSKALAWGSMEMLWECADDAGDPIIGTADAVEEAVQWRGKRGSFASAVREVVLMDVSDDGTYTIHDYWDHAPKYVKDRKAREDQRLVRGETLSDQARRAVNARWEKRRKTNTDGIRMGDQPNITRNTDGIRMDTTLRCTPPALAPALALALPLTPGPHAPTACAPGGSQAIPPEQPEKPNEPMPPEAAEFFAELANIGKPPGHQASVDPDERRELLERQKLVILGGAGR